MIRFVTNIDTDVLLLRTIADNLPFELGVVKGLIASTSTSSSMVVARLLGGRQACEEEFDALRDECVRTRTPFVALSGEAVPDADLTARSTVPAATVAQAHAYFAEGGAANYEHGLRFLADTVLMGGFGFDAPSNIPMAGVWRHQRVPDPGAPTVGIVFYRAHVLSGNTLFVDDLVDAVAARGANALAIYAYSLRGDSPALVLLRDAGVDALITTVLAMGATTDDGDNWAVPEFAALDVPVIQATAATTSSAQWSASGTGLSPLDVAMSVAIPEFDGRVIAVPFSFKEVVDDGDELGSDVTAYRTLPDRVDRVAGIAVNHARLRHVPPEDKRVAIVLSAYPTKRSRLGNAVALDTPASVIELLYAMRRAGYRVDHVPADGDALMHELADGLTYDTEQLSDGQLAAAPGRWLRTSYEQWFASLPPPTQVELTERWGPPPGAVWTDTRDGSLVFPGLDLGGVLVTIQPPRTFGPDVIAGYHSPNEPPTHHYLAFYRWLAEGWGADAVVHVGKHGTLEWLPGKSVGLSAECYPDIALGDLPLFYPFVVNDPGEGTQAKRRAHAVVVDHLLPPMTTAETYGDLARVEAALDEHARIASLDPTKLPAIRRQVWEALVDAELHRDLDLAEADAKPEDDAFDDLLLHVDGYLCELKDAQIRGGLHVLGREPEGQALVDLVVALTRLRQGSVLPLEDPSQIDQLAADGWTTSSSDPTLRWIVDTLLPRLRRTGDEIGNLLHGLDGGYVPSGPSGAPTRGMAHVLPTGRNFYSVDPKALPSPLSYEVGTRLADAVLERHLREEGAYPATVGLVLWGTAAMRTMGDDVAEALALLGVRPVWDDVSGRVTGLELIPADELGRPRIDVTLRISGFFRDAFPHVLDLLDDATELAGYHGDPRIFGPKPSGYGSGIVPLLEEGDWRSDDDLAAVYLAWGGYAYGRGRGGEASPDAARRRFAAIDVAVKNQDNREHDIFDGDDYLQDHGGMIATARSLRRGLGDSRDVKAWFGDSADPSRPRVRSLAEEAARVVRTRVVNPKWIAAMQRHGYKGAFEIAATVDYLYGYDATAHVVDDWMYERVTDAYVADAEMRKFFERSNPWALRTIAERLLEAADRGLWSEPSPEAIAALCSAVLESEAWEESR